MFVCLDNLLLSLLQSLLLIVILSNVPNYNTEIQHYYIEKRHLIRHLSNYFLISNNLAEKSILEQNNTGHLFLRKLLIEEITAQITNN